MRHGVRQVQEERLVFVFADELKRLFRVAFGQQCLVRLGFDHLLVTHQRQRRPAFAIPAHVIAVRNAEVAVEPLIGGQETIAMTEMPLADARRRVAALFEHLSNGDLIGMQPVGGWREDHAGAQTDAFGITPRQQRGP